MAREAQRERQADRSAADDRDRMPDRVDAVVERRHPERIPAVLEVLVVRRRCGHSETWMPRYSQSASHGSSVADISAFFNADSTYGFTKQYFDRNLDVDQKKVEASLGRLEGIKNAQIGIIALADELDVETVSEIFIRINSKGVPLSSADFAMSKIATYGERGRNIRKLIDYFCHLAVAPHVFDDIKENDADFAGSPYLQAIAWLKNDGEDLYDPSYSDVIRVAGLVGFSRGKAASIVSELSGRDPDTHKVDVGRIPLAYDKLEQALLQIVRKYHLENFLMTVKSAGFIEPSLVGSKNALNFAYALYLRLRQDANLSEGERKQVRPPVVRPLHPHWSPLDKFRVHLGAGHQTHRRPGPGDVPQAAGGGRALRRVLVRDPARSVGNDEHSESVLPDVSCCASRQRGQRFSFEKH